MRGRIPIPNGIRELVGGKNIKSVPNCPQFDPGADPPEWLGDYGRKVWFRVAAQLKKASPTLLQQVDAELFACYCDCAEQNQRFLGYLSQAKEDNERRAFWRTIGDIRTVMRTIGAEFGLTPSSRTRIGMQTAPKDELIDFLAEKGKEPA